LIRFGFLGSLQIIESRFTVLALMFDQVIVVVTLTGNVFPVRCLIERRLELFFILHGILVGVVATC
jgi:hypothetical protein